MTPLRRLLLIALTATFAAPAAAPAQSYYSVRLDDAKAINLTPDNFPVRPDGVADATEALQAAINKAQETGGEGIVFVPPGRYRLTATVYVWGGIRIIGYGEKRPALVLAANTPGYMDAAQEKYMVFFSGNRPGTGRGGGGRGTTPQDAGAGTFYSAMSNVDIEIGDGNAGAVGVRGRYAQHSFLAHMDFRIGAGLAGVHDTGNVMEDVHFYGGEYGIWTQRPSPGWQFTAVDATFDGQRTAAIRERAAGLTLVRPRFSNVPTAVAIEPGFHDELWIKDGRMENITGPAIVISNEKNSQTQINMEGVVCDRVPVFAKYQESGRQVAGPGARYEVKTFSYGLSYQDIGATPQTRQLFDTAPLTALPPPVASDLRDLPARDTCRRRRATRARDARGDVYIAAGQIYVYDPSGKEIDRIDVPERPIHLAFGGSDRRTLFIAARTSLYAVRLNNAARARNQPR